MKLRLLSLFAVSLFTAGVLIQLLFSSGVVWAELEASIYGTQAAAGSLNLNCPLVFSSSESGTVTAAITNTLDRSVPPVVTAEISQVAGMQTLSQTLTLAPYETRIVRWSINNSNVIFGRLILVNVVQARYSDLDPHRGFCGILSLDFFSLTGNESLILIVIGGILFIVVGGALWGRVHTPLDELADQTLQACGGLAGVTTMAMLTALPRWWGLTLFLDVFALIMLSVIFTEFLLFPKSNRS